MGPGQSGEIGITWAGEHSRAAAASGTPLEPVHDLLMSETQLRSSPSGIGRSLLGLEKDVCQRESALAPAQGGDRVRGMELSEEGKGGWVYRNLSISNKSLCQVATASHGPPCAAGVSWPSYPLRGSGKPPRLWGVWVQELHRPRLGHGLWQTPTGHGATGE